MVAAENHVLAGISLKFRNVTQQINYYYCYNIIIFVFLSFI